MKFINRKLILILGIVFMISTVFTGCSKISKAEKVFNSYIDLWIQKDYKGMYEMLSSDSKSYISEEDFTKRYTKIYDDIEANNILIEFNGKSSEVEKEIVIPFKINMDTIAGNLDLTDYKVSLVKEDKDYKIKWNESMIFPQMAKDDKIGMDVSPAKRGSILDRDGNPLAYDGTMNVIGIHPSVFDTENRENKIKEMAQILDISESVITDKLAQNSDPDYFVPIVDITPNDSKLEKLKNRDAEGIIIKDTQGRIYNGGEAFGSLIGYIGAITAEELEKNAGKGYDYTSSIGKAGLEYIYEETLRGKDAVDIYIVKNDQRIPLINKGIEDGKDIKLSIDSGLQSKVYSEMGGEKGAAAAVDPKSGDVLALVSSPSYDSNTFTTYKTKTISDLWEKSDYAAQENRFNKVYSPGSTQKLLTTAIGLDNGILKADEEKNITGLAWQKDSSWGGYKITRVTDTGKPVNLRDAVNHSDNIYFAQVALELGADKFTEGLKKFGIGEELEFEYPMGQSQISNNGSFKGDIQLADTGYGQGEIMVTPLHVALEYSALGNEGNIMKPRLVISENTEAKVWKENAISKENLPTIVDAFTALVNDEDGTILDGKVEGFRLAGKTGTAEIKKSQDDTEGTENGWYVSVNPDNSSISLAMIMEDVKDRGHSHFTVPRVRNVMEYYLTR